MMTDERFNRLPKYARDEIQRLRDQQPSKDERVFFRCLEIVLQNCSDWKIGKKPITDAEGYCHLARVFADNSIDVIRSAR